MTCCNDPILGYDSPMPSHSRQWERRILPPLILLVQLTGSGVHELEGHVSDELSTQSAAVDLHPQRVRDDDTHGIRGALALCYHGGRGEVHVVVLEKTQSRIKHFHQQRILSSQTRKRGLALLYHLQHLRSIRRIKASIRSVQGYPEIVSPLFSWLLCSQQTRNIGWY